MRKSNVCKRLTAPPTRRTIHLVGSLAQSVEQLTLNQLVTGSNPVRPTNQISVLRSDFSSFLPALRRFKRAFCKKIRIFRLMFRKVIWRKLQCCTGLYTARKAVRWRNVGVGAGHLPKNLSGQETGNKCAADIKSSAQTAAESAAVA